MTVIKPYITGKPLPSVENIAETVSQYLSTAAHNTHIELAFFGGSFTGIPSEDQDRLLRHAAVLKEEGKIHGIRLSTRPDYIDDSVISRLVRHGVNTVELGVQSMNDTVLRNARRGHTADDTQKAVSLLSQSGIRFVLQLMPGLPGDTFDISMETARIAASLAPSGVRIYPAIVLKDTPMDDMFAKGLFKPLDFESAVALCAAMTELFELANIPVIKTGLHPLRDTGTDAVSAGPYHPSFGFFVRARVRRNQLEKMMDAAAAGAAYGTLHAVLPALCYEEYLGQRRENIDWLTHRFNAYTLIFSREVDATCPKISFTA